METLNDYRNRLDKIDRQLAALFDERMQTVAGVAAYKQLHGLNTLDRSRELQVLDKAADCVSPECEPYVRRLYENIMALSREYQTELVKRRNIVLIGMPGCGKTTVGKALAEARNMLFYDTDEFIGETNGISISGYIRENGEAAFRELEKAACEKLGRLGNAVIATGGGTVKTDAAMQSLRQNAVVVWLKQPDISRLATKGRPLSTDLVRLERERTPLYEAYSDLTILNIHSIDQTVKEISEHV